MSSSCPPASMSIVNLYTSASQRIEMYDENNLLCVATAVTSFDPFNNTATVEGQCSSSANGRWDSAAITTSDGRVVMAVWLDSPINVSAGSVIMLAVTLTWS